MALRVRSTAFSVLPVKWAIWTSEKPNTLALDSSSESGRLPSGAPDDCSAASRDRTSSCSIRKICSNW